MSDKPKPRKKFTDFIGATTSPKKGGAADVRRKEAAPAPRTVSERIDALEAKTEAADQVTRDAQMRASRQAGEFNAASVDQDWDGKNVSRQTEIDRNSSYHDSSGGKHPRLPSNMPAVDRKGRKKAKK